MPIWRRLLITLLVMMLAGFLAGTAWQAIFRFGLPNYLAGVIGGVTALPVWEWLKHR